MKNELKFTLSDYILWIIKIIYYQIIKLLNQDNFNQRHYRLLTPKYSQMPKIYDSKLKKEIIVSINDNINLKTLNEIFIYESYNLKRLSRHEEILTKYRESLINNQRPLILDIGANCGFASIYFSNEFQESQIIAIEPDINNILLAKKNIKNWKNITLLHAGISSSDGIGKILNTSDDNWAFRTVLTENGDIEMLTVDTIFSNLKLHKHYPFIAKIDIEGFEDNLFEKKTDVFDKFFVVIIELHDWLIPKTANSKNFLKWHLKNNRDFIIYGENVFSIKNL